MRRKLLVLIETEHESVSARQAGAAVLRLWNEIAQSGSNLEIRTLRVGRSAGEIVRHLPLLQKASKIVFPYLSPALIDVIGLLRAELKLETPAVFYLHGHASAGPGFFFAFDPYLLEHDEFLVASSAERETLKRCFVAPRMIFVPFLTAVPKKSRPRAAHRPFVYVGRISQQKNLHTLLWAFHKLELRYPDENFELRIYGAEDRLGSPEFGIPATAYLNELKRQSRSLKIRGVRWMGFVNQADLDRGVLSKPHTFVSPSLHIGENYGMAAFHSLALGNPAVLSAWGGHRDFKSIFGKQVDSVPVYGSDTGPFLSPVELCSALENAWRKNSRFDTARILAKLKKSALSELKKSLARTPNRSSLRATRYYQKLRQRLMNCSGKEPLFRGYADPLARPMFQAMGMRSPRARGGGSLEIVPWATIRSGKVTALDPIRGRLEGREVRRWLIRNGLAFQV